MSKKKLDYSDSELKKRNQRLAILLGFIAISFYVGFILSNIK